MEKGNQEIGNNTREADKAKQKRGSFKRGAKNDNKVEGTKYGSKKGKQKKDF